MASSDSSRLTTGGLPLLLLVVMTLSLLLACCDGVAVGSYSRVRRTTDPKQLNPELTSFDEDCPNGYIAYSKFNTKTGVFDCAIKTAEICFALCDTVYSSNWDITNPTSIMDPTDRHGWYCRALPGYPTRPCYFKRKADILRDVANMFAQDYVVA